MRCVVSCIILLRASNGFSNGSLTGSLLASRSHVLPIIWVEAKASATEYAGGVCGIQIIIHEYIFLAMTHYLKRISASTAACCTAPVAHFTLSTDLAYTYRGIVTAVTLVPCLLVEDYLKIQMMVCTRMVQYVFWYM